MDQSVRKRWWSRPSRQKKRLIVGAPGVARLLSKTKAGRSDRSSSGSATTLSPITQTSSGGMQLRGVETQGELFDFETSGQASLPESGERRGPAAWVTYGIDDSVSGPAKISKDPVGLISRGKILTSGSSSFERVQRNRVIFLALLLIMVGLVLYQTLLA